MKQKDRIYPDIEFYNKPYVKDGQLAYMKGYKYRDYEL